MISPKLFLKKLRSLDINFFVGVPDSLMKGLNIEISNKLSEKEHVIASNEGSAIAQAIGYYIATDKVAAVYMQNSGIGNAYNPLLSLANKDVYGIPMLLLIGWRGELNDDGEQLKDEPQHVKQGKVTLETLETMGIKYILLDHNTNDWDIKIEELIKKSIKERSPVAVVFRKNTFEKTLSTLKPLDINPQLMREEAIEEIVDLLSDDYIFVASTGMISRELFETRKRKKMPNHSDFLTVGGMGHASQIAVSIAKIMSQRAVVCLDGDGSLIMHFGGMLQCAKQSNLIHIVLNNGAHDSVGGQPTNAFKIDLQAIASGFGYTNSFRVSSINELHTALDRTKHGSTFVEILCKRGNRKDLGRPNKTPKENLKDFMKFLRN
jgi:phosphonopyruvate decarboxylase